MASTSEELFAAIEAGDAAGVRALLARDPAVAGARDAEGVSARMRARYRSDREIMDELRSAGGELDVFEAASFGAVDRLAGCSSTRSSCVRSARTDSRLCTSPPSSAELMPRSCCSTGARTPTRAGADG